MKKQQLSEENEKLLEMQQRIDELETYNLDLANESHSKSLKIDELEKENAELRAIIDKRFADGFKLRHTTRQLTDHIGLEAQDKREVLAQHDKEVIDNFIANLFSQLPNPPRRVWVSDLKLICEQLQEQS